MKKNKLCIVLIVVLVMLSTSGCGLLEKNCSVKDCDSEIYEDGLCKYHYIQQVGEDALKGLINGK